MGEAKRRRDRVDDEIGKAVLEWAGQEVLAGRLVPEGGGRTLSMDTVLTRPGAPRTPDYARFLDFVDLIERLDHSPVPPAYAAAQIAEFDLGHWTAAIPRTIDWLRTVLALVRLRIADRDRVEVPPEAPGSGADLRAVESRLLAELRRRPTRDVLLGFLAAAKDLGEGDADLPRLPDLPRERVRELFRAALHANLAAVALSRRLLAALGETGTGP